MEHYNSEADEIKWRQEEKIEQKDSETDGIKYRQ